MIFPIISRLVHPFHTYATNRNYTNHENTGLDNGSYFLLPKGVVFSFSLRNCLTSPPHAVPSYSGEACIIGGFGHIAVCMKRRGGEGVKWRY